jgi:hypothetical protein
MRPTILTSLRRIELCVSVWEMAGQHHCTVRAEAYEDEAQDRVGKAEEDGGGAMRNERDDSDEPSNPGHQAGARLRIPHSEALLPNTE